ncbi:MAG TPA: hypothetical protein VIN72_05590 [Lutibacter sp.]
MKKILLSIILLFVIHTADAQCAMCRAVVESGSSSEAAGLNSGILYLMSFPYILMATLFIIIVRYRMTNREIDEF